MLAQERRLRFADFFLHADEIKIGQRQNPGKALDRDGAIVIVQMRAAAASPAQTYA